MGGFEELEVWERAVELSAEIYTRTRDLKDFEFRDQITRAGLSIPSNIAEGLERSWVPDQIKFLDYARASSEEVRAHTTVYQKVGFIPKQAADDWTQETRGFSAMIQGLICSIRNRNTN